MILAAKAPEAPLNLRNVSGLTTAYQIGVQWDDGLYDGASSVLDYELSYKLSTDNDWIIWAPSLIVRTDIITGLTAGSSYSFIVKSRNVINFSVYSEEVTVLVA